MLFEKQQEVRNGPKIPFLERLFQDLPDLDLFGRHALHEAADANPKRLIEDACRIDPDWAVFPSTTSRITGAPLPELTRFRRAFVADRMLFA